MQDAEGGVEPGHVPGGVEGAGEDPLLGGQAADIGAQERGGRRRGGRQREQEEGRPGGGSDAVHPGSTRASPGRVRTFDRPRVIAPSKV
ncbi:hypothetical protein ACWD4P_12065 [Kitasatospora sp. NPDC002543]